MTKVQKAIDAVRDALHNACETMSPFEYKRVLEELSGDLDGNLEALRDENPELWEKDD
jgi:hypothetical protein